MGFSLRLAGVPKAEIAKRVGEAAEIIGLTDYLERQPKELSGGQRQRVAMGRAIVRDPQVFLFDEPLSNLDAKLRVQMRAEIKALQKSLATTTVYVTHDQVEAMTMADQIVVMHGGIIQQQGAPLELYDKPANQFVASFIGSPSMNFFDAECVEGGVRLKDGHLVSTHPPAPQGQNVILGVRPEHLSIGTGGSEAVVTVTEPLGNETLVQLEHKGAAVTMLTKDRVVLAPGETVSLTFNTDILHFFDPETGQRI